MAPRLSLTQFDRALAAAAAVARQSPKLSRNEKAELTKLAKQGASGFTLAERARCAMLIRKAGPETWPKLPPWVRERLGRLWRRNPSDDPPLIPPTHGPPEKDPLDRLRALGALRGKPLSDQQFEARKRQLLADPSIGTWGAEDGIDDLERLAIVGQLAEATILTADEAHHVTSQILDAAS